MSMTQNKHRNAANFEKIGHTYTWIRRICHMYLFVFLYVSIYVDAHM